MADQVDTEVLAQQFEEHRPRLHAVAYRMLGSAAEADDAVQEAWLRLARSDVGDVENLAGWLTTVVSRICLDMLRSRTSRHEQPLGPESTVAGARSAAASSVDPAHEAEQADAVGRALLVVLDRLSPPERVAFVLHDLFAVPFEQVAPVVGRSPVAAKKLASRARHRVDGTATADTAAVPPADLARQRELVGAYLGATRRGDIGGLLAVLAPEVVRHADPAALPAGVATVLRGADAVAAETSSNARRAQVAELALIDGAVGVVVAPTGKLRVAITFTIEDGRIAGIDVVADPDRLAALDLAVLPD